MTRIKIDSHHRQSTKASKKVTAGNIDIEAVEVIPLIQHLTCELEKILIPEQELLVKLIFYAHKMGEDQRLPTPLLIHHHLPRLKFKLAGAGEVKYIPHGIGNLGFPEVGPEKRPRLPVLRLLKEKGRIPHHRVVGVQIKHLGKA